LEKALEPLRSSIQEEMDEAHGPVRESIQKQVEQALRMAL
jgi:hypothetical protein